MTESHTTRFSLIARIQDNGDGSAWDEFVEIYTPVVYGIVRKRGLQDADAADVTQDVFRTVAQSIGKFRCDNELGSFRGWLMTVVRSRLNDHLNNRGRQIAGSADTAIHKHIEQATANDNDDHLWDIEYRRSLFRWACDQVRPSFREATWQAFWQTSVEGLSGKEVGQSLGMTEGAVYIAKCRVVAQLRKKIKEIEEQ